MITSSSVCHDEKRLRTQSEIFKQAVDFNSFYYRTTFLLTSYRLNLQKRYNPNGTIVLTLVSPNVQKKYKKNLENMKKYASKHKYTFKSETYNEYPPHFGKTSIIRTALDSYKDILFLDADSVILDINTTISSIVENANIFFSGSPSFSSSHIVFIRNSKPGREFLEDWELLQNLIRKCHYDQGSFVFAMAKILSKNVFKERKFRQVRTELSECMKQIQGSRIGIRNPCRKFQTCISLWAHYWLPSFFDLCINKDITPLYWIRQESPRLSILKLNESRIRHGTGEKVKQVYNNWQILNRRIKKSGITWQCSNYNSYLFSLQGTRNSKFDICSNNTKAFSVHPIKRWEQLTCSNSNLIQQTILKNFNFSRR